MWFYTKFYYFLNNSHWTYFCENLHFGYIKTKQTVREKKKKNLFLFLIQEQNSLNCFSFMQDKNNLPKVNFCNWIFKKKMFQPFLSVFHKPSYEVYMQQMNKRKSHFSNACFTPSYQIAIFLKVKWFQNIKVIKTMV